MVKEHTFILMGINTSDNGRTGKNMVKEHTLMLVDLSMKANSGTGQWMARESSPGTKELKG